MDTTKPQKEPKTCHNCGLEAIEAIDEDLCIIADNALENMGQNDNMNNVVMKAIDKAIEQSEVGESIPVQHLPAYPESPPCKWCERNPNKDIDIMTDFYSENWTSTINQGQVKAFFDDLTPRDKALLRLLQYAERFYGGDTHGER
jgi:hypothetical protein